MSDKNLSDFGTEESRLQQSIGTGSTSSKMEKILRTEIINFRNREKEPFVKKRRKRIEEAVSWEGGPSTENPEEIVVDKLPSGQEAYFLKPGKETERKEPNPNDMAPRIEGVYKNYTFQDTWEIISRTSVKNFEYFKALLVLIYRNTYLLDHREKKGGIRYDPSEEIKDVIKTLDKEFKDILPEGNTLGLLYFLDLLGWNEDVKYQAPRTDYDLFSDFNVGRVNNLLTSIKIPYKLSVFVRDVLDYSGDPKEIPFGEGLETVQDLTVSRGTCKPTQGELREWFSPMLY